MSALTSPDNIVYPVSTDQVAPLESVLASMASSMQSAITGQRKYYSTVMADQAARDAAFPNAVQGDRVFRADKGWEEGFFALYSATNPGGATPAGWYPLSGNLPIGIAKRTGGVLNSPADTYTNIGSDAAWSGATTGGGVLRGGMTYVNGFVVPIAGVYIVSWQLMLTGGSFPSTGGVARNMGATLTGGQFLYGAQSIQNGGAYMGSGSASIVCAPGDKLTLWTYSSGGVSTVVTSGPGIGWSASYQGPAQ